MRETVPSFAADGSAMKALPPRERLAARTRCGSGRTMKACRVPWNEGSAPGRRGPCLYAAERWWGTLIADVIGCRSPLRLHRGRPAPGCAREPGLRMVVSLQCASALTDALAERTIFVMQLITDSRAALDAVGAFRHAHDQQNPAQPEGRTMTTPIPLRFVRRHSAGFDELVRLASARRILPSCKHFCLFRVVRPGVTPRAPSLLGNVQPIRFHRDGTAWRIEPLVARTDNLLTLA